MSVKIDGLFETEIYSIDDGYVAIEQSFGTVVLLAADDLPIVIAELQAYYEHRAQWQEPLRS